MRAAPTRARAGGGPRTRAPPPRPVPAPAPAHSALSTRRYAHVTFFFNGGREEPFEGEERELKESPKVATYDLEPKMAAEPVADAMVREIEAGKHTLLICNLAPPDMVGHTGMFDKAMEAAAHTDYCVGKVRDACVKAGVGLFILADHGNCETMLTPDGKPITSHSTSNTSSPSTTSAPNSSTARCMLRPLMSLITMRAPCSWRYFARW